MQSVVGGTWVSGCGVIGRQWPCGCRSALAGDGSCFRGRPQCQRGERPCDMRLRLDWSGCTPRPAALAISQSLQATAMKSWSRAGLALLLLLAAIAPIAQALSARQSQAMRDEVHLTRTPPLR